MSLALSVAVGLLLGNLLWEIGKLLFYFVARRLVEQSPRWRSQVRRVLRRRRAMEATLVGPWVTRER